MRVSGPSVASRHSIRYVSTVADKVFIVGAGTTGFQLAKHLIADSKDVVLVEKNPDVAKYATNNLDCIVLNEAGNNLAALEEAGIEEADFFIALTGSDELNMISCGLVSNEFAVPCKIARVRNSDYSRTQLQQKSFLDIDFFVSPEIEAANSIVKSVEQGAISDITFFEKSSLQMRNIFVDTDSFFRDKTVEQTRKDLDLDFLIVGISHSDQFSIPSADTVVRENDELYLVASEGTLEQLFARVGRPKIPLKKVVVVGGGRVGSFVAKALIEKSKSARSIEKLVSYLTRKQIQLKIVDSDYEICKRLANRFPDVIVINSDISEERFFEQEGLTGQDLIITTTANPELNILAAIYAKTFDIKRSIALVNKYNYQSIASRLGIDVIISPKNSVVNAVLKFVRRGKVKSVNSIFGGQAEIIETEVDSSSDLAGEEIRDLRLPKNTLIISISRDGETIFPHRDFVIEDGDKLLVIGQSSSITKVADVLARSR